MPDLHLKYNRPLRLNERTAIQSVRFSNVKEYTIDLSRYYGRIYGLSSHSHLYEFNAENVVKDKLLAVEFDRLETLKYETSFPDNLDQQIDFVGQYNGVRSLDFSSFVLRYEHMKRLVDLSPNLSEITLRCSPIGVAAFLQLMSETHLETIHVLVSDTLRDRFLQATLPEEWFLQADTGTKIYRPTVNTLTYSRNHSG